MQAETTNAKLYINQFER